MLNRADHDIHEGRTFRLLFGLAVAAALAGLAAGSLVSVLDDDDSRALAQGAEERYRVQQDTDAAAADRDTSAPGGSGAEVTNNSPQDAGSRRLWSGRGHRAVSVRKGERVGVHESPNGKLVERARPKTEFGSVTTFSVLERRDEWLEVVTPIAADNRPLWIKADPDKLNFYTTRLSIHASLADRVVELRRGKKVVERFEVTVGAAGSSTPAGRFAVTDLIVGGLNPVYGCCAIALTAHQTDLPPGWIGGDRVAIHGTTGPVGAAASSGCIRAEDSDAMSLVERVPLGTPVFIDT